MNSNSSVEHDAEIESTETPKPERYLVTALVESADVLTHLTETVKAAGAAVVKTEALGLRKLAFPIAKRSDLELISVFFETNPATINDLEKTLKTDATLKRFLLTKWSVDPNAEPRSRTKREKVGVTS